MFRLRNYQDLQTCIDEVSALIDKKDLLEMYTLATEDASSFLYCRLTSKNKNQLFMLLHEKYLTVEDNYFFIKQIIIRVFFAFCFTQQQLVLY